MLKQTITFKDFNGEDRTEDLYFNLTEWELTEMQADSEEGIQKEMMDAVKAKDLRRLLDFIKMLVHRAYGERDKDGIHFHKSEEITNRFINSAMYSPLLLSLFQDEGKRAQEFITGLMPADLVQRAIAQSEGGGGQNRPQFQDHLSKQENKLNARVVETKSLFNEAPVIGQQEFQAPITPDPATYNPRVQSEHNPQDAAPVQAGSPEEFQPFRVKEESIMDEAQLAEFREWQARRDSGNV